MALAPMMPRGLFGSGMPAMQKPMAAPMAAPAEEPKSWLEGGKMRTRDIIGLALAGIGDAFGMPGQQNMSNLIQQRMMMTAQQRAEEQRRKTGFDDFVQRKTWERDNMPPEMPEPTAMQRNYEFLSRQNPELGKQYLESQAIAPPLVVPNADGTRTIYPAGAIPRANSGPQVGAIEDGYRFKGGNPGDPNAWEKVGGGGSNVTGGFLSGL